MSHILCPSCTELVAANAARCAHCGELLREFRECPECLERIRAGAKSCRYCGYRLPRTSPPPVPPVPSPAGMQRLPAPPAVPGQGRGQMPSQPAGDYTVGATPLGGFFAERSFSALVAPPELRLAEGLVTIRRWSALGLRSESEYLPVARVGAVHLVRGSLWSGIRLDPVGFGPSLEISGIRSDEARAMVQLLEEAALPVPPPSPPPAVPVSSSSSHSEPAEESRGH